VLTNALPPKSPQTESHAEEAEAASVASNVSASRRAALPVWLRAVLPSVTDLFFVLLLGSLACGTLAQKLLGDAGIGWHIRDGEQILSTHAVPRNDPFSSTTEGKPWYAWEWLYDFEMGIIHEHAGLNGVVFLSALIIAFVFAYLFRLLLARGTILPLAVLFVLLGAAASTIHFLARPHIVSWLLTLIWFQILDSCEASSITASSKVGKAFWLPVLMLLWVNLHGGFLMGFVLLGIYLTAAGWQYFSSRNSQQRLQTRRWARTLGAVSGLSVLASFINPYGYKLHVHVYQYLSSRFLMDHIDEFLSPNFHGFPQKCFALLLLVTMSALATARQRPRPSHLLVILFATWAGLYAARNIPISSILLCIVVAPVLSHAFAESVPGGEVSGRLHRYLSRLKSFSERMGSLEARLGGHFWPAAALVLGMGIALHQGRLGSLQIMDAHFDGKRFPAQAVEVLAGKQVHEPVFSLDLWGGYLIYRLYPQLKVVVDDRHDLYGEAFLKDYLKTIRAEPGWDKLLNENHVSWVLIPVNSSLTSILKMTPEWKIIHQDDTAIVFRRDSGIPDTD